jgi:hypothetical protein
MKCPKCGSSEWVIVHHSYNFCDNGECNTVWTRWQQAEIERLKLKWQTGEPPEDGWYFVKNCDGAVEVIYLEPSYGDHLMYSQWAGPILPPE